MVEDDECGFLIGKIVSTEDFEFLLMSGNELSEYPEWIRTVIKSKDGSLYFPAAVQVRQNDFLAYLQHEKIQHIITTDNHIYISEQDSIDIFPEQAEIVGKIKRLVNAGKVAGKVLH